MILTSDSIQTSNSIHPATSEVASNVSDVLSHNSHQLELEQIALGDQLCLQGELAAAADSYYQATQFNPRSVSAFQKLVAVLTQLEERDKAAYLLQSAIESNPDNFKLHCLQGELLSSQGNFEAAIASYHRALALNPDLAEIQARLSRVGAALQGEAPAPQPEIFVTRSTRSLPEEIEAIVDLDVKQARRVLMDAAIVEQFETMLRQTLLLPQQNGELLLDTQALLRCLAELQTDIHYLKTKLQNPPAEAVDPQAKEMLNPSELLSPQPSITRCNMRQRIVGQGWHEPEQNGRWTGPTDSSSIALPYPKLGRYRFEMLVLAEAIPGLLNSLELYVNETPLDFVIKQSGTQQLPAVVQGEMTLDSKEQPFLAIDILIEKTVLPQNTSDERLLGLLISHINLIPVQEQ